MQMTLPPVNGRITLPVVSDDVILILLGYYYGPETERIFVAFDASKHMSHGRSPSLQVKGASLEKARIDGLALQNRNNGERIVVFPAAFFAEYIEGRDALHDLSAGNEAANDPAVEPEVRLTLDARFKVPEPPPTLEPGTRQRLFTSVTRAVRQAKFSQGIRSVYDRCAICGFQYDDILEAAHIVPFSDPMSSDDYANGMALCPICHALYDRGYILVDGELNITLHSRYAADFREQGKAGSLSELSARLRDKLWVPSN